MKINFETVVVALALGLTVSGGLGCKPRQAPRSEVESVITPDFRQIIGLVTDDSSREWVVFRECSDDELTKCGGVCNEASACTAPVVRSSGGEKRFTRDEYALLIKANFGFLQSNLSDCERSYDNALYMQSFYRDQINANTSSKRQLQDLVDQWDVKIEKINVLI